MGNGINIDGKTKIKCARISIVSYIKNRFLLHRTLFRHGQNWRALFENIRSYYNCTQFIVTRVCACTGARVFRIFLNSFKRKKNRRKKLLSTTPERSNYFTLVNFHDQSVNPFSIRSKLNAVKIVNYDNFRSHYYYYYVRWLLHGPVKDVFLFQK